MISDDFDVPIVGIGASAGGLRAMEQFFAALPANLGVSYVVIQHLAPDHPSALTALIQRMTQMRVVSIEENIRPQLDTVYVNLPNQDIEVGQELIVRRRNYLHADLYLPIDGFFQSLADARGSNAVAIVLSGMGSDGSRGIKAVREVGGLVLIQSPISAQFDGMPRSAVNQKVADVILDPDALALRYANIVRRGRIVVQEEIRNHPSALENIFGRIEDHYGIDFRKYRSSTLRRRIEKRMLIRQLPDVEAYLALVMEDEEELKVLAQGFLIGVTRFFRDREAFRSLSEDVIIPLLQRERSEEEPLRLWVASCSTGEEAYTLAILLYEAMDELGIQVPFKLFATDVNAESIRLATAGRYDSSIRAEVPPPILEKYFHWHDWGYEVNVELRNSIVFTAQNLLNDPPFIRLDLITCRNFLIYVDAPHQLTVLRNFHFALREGGCLMLGPSENLADFKPRFEVLNRRWRIFRRRGGKLNLPIGFGKSKATANATPRESDGTLSSLPPVRAGYPMPPVLTPPGNETYSPVNDQFARYLADQYAPFSLFVDGNYAIQYLNGDLGRILRYPRYFAQMTLRDVLPDVSVAILESGVDQALSTEEPFLYRNVEMGREGEEPQLFDVKIDHVNLQDGKTMALLEFRDGRSLEDDSEVSSYHPDEVLRKRVVDLENQLRNSEARARTLLTELEATNEELQSSNRELMASNEEMQSTNEELQSVNEELYTVNTELQRKNEELNSANLDISNLLEGSEVGTIFLDSNMRIRRYTPAISHQFDLHPTDLGRPIASFSSSITNFNLPAEVQQVLASNERMEREITMNNGDTFLARILPYRISDDDTEGVIISFVRITELVKTRAELTETARKYQAILRNSGDAIMILKDNGRIQESNATEWFDPQQDVIGQFFVNLLAEEAEYGVFERNFRAVFEDGQSRRETFRLRLTDDLYYADVNFVPLVHDRSADMLEELMLIISDVTKRVAERQDLELKVERYRNDNELSRAGLLGLDGGVHYISPDNDVKGPMPGNITELMSERGGEKFTEAMREVRAKAQEVTVEYEEGEILVEQRPYCIVYRPILANGSIVFVYAQDVTNT